jgi:putative glutamine amidotransferase
MRGPSRRVALTQRVDDLPERGERRDALDQAWTVRIEAAGFVPVLIPNRLADPVGYLEELEPALLIVSGGNDLAHLPAPSQPAPERDHTETVLLDAATARGLPVLGVCRGLQLMVAHTGGALVGVDGHVRASHAITVVDASVWPLRDGRVVNSFHGWGITPAGLGPLLAPLALAPDGTVEAAHRPGLPQVGIMWHPEREPFDPGDLDLVRALVEHELHACNRSRRR